MNYDLRLEEVKLKFKAVFNKNADDYRFAGASHIDLVAEYGLCLGDLKESISMVDLHLKIQEEFSRYGHHLSDGSIKDLILSAINTY